MSTNNKLKRNKDWQKFLKNNANLKYTKDYIISSFAISNFPQNFTVPVELRTECSGPISVSYSIPNCENSRKPRKAKKERNIEYRIEIIQETKSNNKKNNEKKKGGKDEIIEEKNDVKDFPEFKYSENLVESHVILGNPFALFIKENSSIKRGFMLPNSASFKPMWFYKDPLGEVHGPFTSIDMFNWTAAGYFTSQLPVAAEKPVIFYPLALYYEINAQHKSN